jgi:ribosomal protein S18 acetylase RimI-like enzyme
MNLRRATVSDAPGIAQVSAATWQFAYKNILPIDYLATRSLENTTRRFTRRLQKIREDESAFVVEESPGEIIGFTFGGPPQEASNNFDAELQTIYVLPAHQRRRRGIGRTLFAAIADFLYNRGFGSIFAWTFVSNQYSGFYTKLGGLECGRRTRDYGAVSRESVAYGWQEIQTLIENLYRLHAPPASTKGKGAEERGKKDL